ncbi:hypothetical protein HDU86_001833 [Geranomyces michiganensis]|nr:hypothetical protein HDU86_001833 [Geranomyces michiganensis]
MLLLHAAGAAQLAAALVLLAIASAGTSAAAASPDSYPVFPYYSITWNNAVFNITWAATQPAVGDGPSYPYPVIQSEGKVQPFPYPNYDYACSQPVNGTDKSGTCSLGGRGRMNFGGCKEKTTTTGAGGVVTRRGVPAIPDHPACFPKVLPRSEIDDTQSIVGEVYYCRIPRDGAQITSDLATDRPQVAAGQFAAAGDGSDFVSTPWDSLGWSGIANASTGLTRRDGRSCSMQVMDFVKGVFQLSAENITGVCVDYETYSIINWDCTQTIATYDTAGTFLSMKASSVTCGGAVYQGVAVFWRANFPCAATSTNPSPTQENICATFWGPLNPESFSALSIRQFPCVKTTTLWMPMDGLTKTIDVATMCVAFQSFGKFPSTVQYWAPCYSGGFGSTCMTEISSYEPFSAVVSCNTEAARLYNGKLTKSSIKTCLQTTSSEGHNQTFSLDCSRWTNGQYESTQCSVLFPPPPEWGRYVSSRPCRQTVPALYVNGLLENEQVVDLTCMTHTENVGYVINDKIAGYHYNTTVYWYPCQKEIKLGADKSVVSYLDTTCYQKVLDSTPVADPLWLASLPTSKWNNFQWIATRYFNGAAVLTEKIISPSTGFLLYPSFIKSFGNYWSAMFLPEIKAWMYKCIGSQSGHTTGLYDNKRVGTFAINSTHCGAYSLESATPQLEKSTLYIYPSRGGSTDRSFCQAPSAIPGVTACTTSGCTTLPGQSLVPPCDDGKVSYTIGYDDCVEDYQYPPEFDAFTRWSSTLATQPTRGGDNSSFWFPSKAGLDVIQLLTRPNFTIHSKTFAANSSVFPGGTWTGPLWPELALGSSTPLYSLPFGKQTSSPSAPSDATSAPWPSFPFVPGEPLAYAPSNVSLDSTIIGGVWPFPTWPAVAFAMDKKWESGKPWIVFPYLREAGVVPTCPRPPTAAKLYASDSWVVAGKILTAYLSLSEHECLEAGDGSHFWSLDVPAQASDLTQYSQKAIETASRYSLQIPTANLTEGRHDVTVRAVFMTMEGYPITILIASETFTVKSAIFKPSLSLANGTVPAAWPLTLDATTSSDTLRPCFFKSYAPIDAYHRCTDLNGYDYNYDYISALMVFSCVTVSGGPCPFKLTSTTSWAQLARQDARSNSTYTAMSVAETASGLIITTDTPILVIPASAVVEGTFIFSFRYSYGDLWAIYANNDLTTSRMSDPIAITVSSQAQYCSNLAPEATMTFPEKSGSGIPSFVAGAGGKAVVSISSVSCPDVQSAPWVFWSGDGNVTKNPLNPMLPQGNEERTDSLTWTSDGTGRAPGLHTLSARIVYFTANHQFLATVVVSATVNLIEPTFHPRLSNSNATVPISRDLVLDATGSTDNVHPCSMERYVSDAALRACRANNPDAAPYNGYTWFVFVCSTPKRTACPLQLSSTASPDDMYDGKVSSNATFTAMAVFNDTREYIVFTDRPTLVIPSAKLVVGKFLWLVAYFYDDLDDFFSPDSPNVLITVSSTSSYLNLRPLSLATQQTTFLAGAIVRISANVSTDSAAASLNFLWSVTDAAGGPWDNTIVAKSANTANIRIDTSTMAAGTYTAKLMVQDGNSNTASSSTAFTVTKSLPAPTGCSVTPLTGIELKTLFAVVCPEAPLGLLYSFSYIKDGVETNVAYPGASYQELILPSSKNGSVSIRIRHFMLGNFASSDFQPLDVTLSPNPGSAGDLATSLSGLLTTGANAAQTAAVVDGFVSKLTAMNTSDPATKAMVGNVVSALTSQVNANVDPATAVSQTGTIAKLLASGAVGEESKRNASAAILTLASVLATPGFVVAKSTLESAAAACLNAAVANSTDSADAVLGSFGFLGVALRNTLAVGGSATLAVPGAQVQVFSIDPEAIPAKLSSGSLSRRDSVVAATCDADVGATISGIVAASTVGAAVNLQSNCFDRSPYPVDTSKLQTDTVQVATGVLSLSMQVNGMSVSSPLAQNVNVTIPTTYSPVSRVARRATVASSSYSTECVMWNSTTSAWSPDACTVVGSNAPSGSSTSCTCSKLGSYAVRLVVVSKTTITPPAGDDGLVLTPAQLYGAIAGGIAFIVLLSIATFILVKKELKARKAAAEEKQNGSG